MKSQFVPPRLFRWIAVVALVLLCVIIVTGAGVRLTKSGLGCPDWPNCESGRLTPRSASNSKAMIEFVNRVFTGAVSVSVILAVLASVFRRPRRRDLTWLSAGLIIGVLANAVLGGISVKFRLAPPLVAGHFVLSMLLIWDALVLVRRAWVPDGAKRQLAVTPRVRALARALFVAVWFVVLAGTVVTGSGPHAGDAAARRYNLSITDTARVHGTFVWIFLALTIVAVIVAWKSGAPRSMRRALTWLLVAIVVQAGIGYLQYFTGVPAGLVALHIAGAVAVFLATVWVSLMCSDWKPGLTGSEVAPIATAIPA